MEFSQVTSDLCILNWGRITHSYRGQAAVARPQMLVLRAAAHFVLFEAGLSLGPGTGLFGWLANRPHGSSLSFQHWVRGTSQHVQLLIWILGIKPTEPFLQSWELTVLLPV